MANLVGEDGQGGQAGQPARAGAAHEAHRAAPDLVDVETVAALRERSRAGDLTARRFEAAGDDLPALPMDRFPTGALMVPAHELRADTAPYDDADVALAGSLGDNLVTADARLSRAPGIRCRVEVLST